MTFGTILKRDFYNRPTVEVARALLGRLFNLRTIVNRPSRLRTAYRKAGCQPAAGCHPAPRAASDSTFMSHTRQ
jgi:hypothetical protein